MWLPITLGSLTSARAAGTLDARIDRETTSRAARQKLLHGRHLLAGSSWGGNGGAGPISSCPAEGRNGKNHWTPNPHSVAPPVPRQSPLSALSSGLAIVHEESAKVAGTLRVPSAASSALGGRHTECACYFTGRERSLRVAVIACLLAVRRRSGTDWAETSTRRWAATLAATAPCGSGKGATGRRKHLAAQEHHPRIHRVLALGRRTVDLERGGQVLGREGLLHAGHRVGPLGAGSGWQSACPACTMFATTGSRDPSR